MSEISATTAEAAVVHIVDDDRSVRAALDRLLRSVGYSTVGYGSAAEFLEAEIPSTLGCLVLDVRLPGTSGLELQEYLNRADFILPLVLMTAHGDIQMSVKAMKAGAVDFLTKPFREQDMLDAINNAIDVHRKRRSISLSVADVKKRFDLLSTREQQVFASASAGRLNKQIANELGIAEATVKVHRASAMRKMRAKSVAELARMAEIMSLSG